MWKPGASRPDDRSSSSPLSRSKRREPPNAKQTNVYSSNSNNEQLPEHAERNLGPPTAVAASPSRPGLAKKLSGATMNMRFMQRKTALTAQQSLLPSTGTTRTTHTAASCGAQSQDPLVDQKMSHDAQHELSRIAHDAARHGDLEINNHNIGVSSEKATPSEMYGVYQSNIIGRRSFGGFHKHMEETWNRSYQAQRQQLREQKQQQKTTTTTTDEEILQRYEAFVGGSKKRKHR